MSQRRMPAGGCIQGTMMGPNGVCIPSVGEKKKRIPSRNMTVGRDCDPNEVDLGWGDCNEYTSGNNNSIGCMPSGCWSTDYTTEIDVRGHRLPANSQIPPEIGQIWGLQILGLANNVLTGQIPPEIANAPNLRWIQLYDNSLTGPIPSSIGNMANLESLYLGSNQLSGVIPPEIGNASNLELINLTNNNFTGTLPSSIGNLTNLKELSVSYNNMSGDIPESICNLSNLEELHLEYNHFCPPHPDCCLHIISDPNPECVNQNWWDINVPGVQNESQCNYGFSFCQPTDEWGYPCITFDYLDENGCDAQCNDSFQCCGGSTCWGEQYSEDPSVPSVDGAHLCCFLFHGIHAQAMRIGGAESNEYECIPLTAQLDSGKKTAPPRTLERSRRGYNKGGRVNNNKRITGRTQNNPKGKFKK